MCDAHCRKKERATRSGSFLFAKRVFYLFLLLLLFGDVVDVDVDTAELNPNQPVEMEILQSLQKAQTEILNKLASIESRIAKHEGMRVDIKDSHGATKKQVEDLGRAIAEHKDDISILQKKFKDLPAKNVDLENRSWRQNLLFYGVDDNKGLTQEQLLEYTATNRPYLIHARIMGKTRSALLTFDETRIPYYIKFDCGTIRCQPCRRALQTCTYCSDIGHRQDVCPHPNKPR